MPSNFTLFSFLILGDGKSHLIRTRLRNRLSHMVLNIPISEAFTPLSAIKKLQALPTDTRGCCIYFNFTMLPPSVSIHISVCLKLYVHVQVSRVGISAPFLSLWLFLNFLSHRSCEHMIFHVHVDIQCTNVPTEVHVHVCALHYKRGCHLHVHVHL